MILIKILILFLLFFVIFLLFLPLLRKEEYHYDTDGLTAVKEFELEKKYLERQMQDLLLDKDSGKITEEEWENLIQPVKNKIQTLDEKIKTLKGKL
jgi:competence protein ComGC